MTDQEINIAIAEACGWHTFGLWNGNAKQVAAYPPDESRSKIIPNYCHDLNAMHEMEEHLNTALMEPTIYSNELLAIVGKAVSVTSPMAGCFFHIHATARQRAEAFLRCMGLWREAK